jgi:nucleotide-binding universal stress UspA family protein
MNTEQPIRHILVAHDFQDVSAVALDYALALAKPFGARVTVVHAYDISAIGAPEVLVLATDWIKQIAMMAQEALDKVVTAARETGVSVEPQLREGAAWRQVEAVAKEQNVDLVVVGSHGRRGVSRALLGSVAEKVVRTAPCPVLVVRG